MDRIDLVRAFVFLAVVVAGRSAVQAQSPFPAAVLPVAEAVPVQDLPPSFAQPGGPEFWVVHARCLPPDAVVEGGVDLLGIYRCIEGHGWQRTGLGELTSPESARPTIFYVHGINLDHEEAIQAGWWLYRSLRHTGAPVRVVLWSWSSQSAVARPIPDLRIRACRAQVQGYYLARMVEQMPPGTPITLAGHSHGAITCAAALHDLGSRSLGSQDAVDRNSGPHASMRAVLVAASFDNDQLRPGGRFGLALSAAERILVTTNGRDYVLRWYPCVSCCRRGALGFCGPAGAGRLPAADKLEVLDMSRSLGSSHAWRSYVDSPRFAAFLRCFVLPSVATSP